jgi:hypothetical protein
MACVCTCGRVIDCGTTKYVLCEEDEEASVGFYTLPPEELPKSGLGMPQ